MLRHQHNVPGEVRVSFHADEKADLYDVFETRSSGSRSTLYSGSNEDHAVEAYAAALGRIFYATVLEPGESLDVALNSRWAHLR